MTRGTLRVSVGALAVGAVALAAASSAQQAAPAPPPQPVGIIGASAGTGPYSAVAESDASLRTHTLYHPAAMPDEALPLVLWGNGGCRDDGLSHGAFLREVASHGFFVISLGYPRVERGVEAPPAPGAAPARGGAPGTGREGRGTAGPGIAPNPQPQGRAGAAAPRPPDATQAAQMIEALEWATQQNTAPGRWRGRIDVTRVATMGHSCGGLQAITIAADPRIDTAVILNSGVLNGGPASGLSGIQVTKAQLADLHAPVAYITGGPGDVAHANAADDVERVNHVPVFWGYDASGHSGTFWSAPNGGEYAQVAAAWLRWQLKGDEEAARMFRGPACGLCTRPGWTVVKKRID